MVGRNAHYAGHRFTQAEESVKGEGSGIHPTEEPSLIDLSQIDFEALKEHFEKICKRTGAEKLLKLVGEYNKGLDVDTFFAKLTDFVKELNEEEQRGVAEQLTEEELALFDILTKPEFDMSAKEKEGVKKVARKLLQTLKQAKLVLD